MPDDQRSRGNERDETRIIITALVRVPKDIQVSSRDLYLAIEDYEFEAIQMMRDTQEGWVYEGYEYRDRIGRRVKNGNGSWWHRFACNDADCSAYAVVRWDVLSGRVTSHVDA